ncbi:MAG: cupin domain-containing protein [bacterium]|nr:cupin domain-containing protein [bacterium]MXZ29293.1 cupin domain-containing protein [Acidimicrobiia bacterium]MYB24483.1 cupin domain-containing protein [Acidimicrobiia bacterium]MYE67805.1 cupin domain-containing protein [Acidimicrobiia bacterium]MYJ14198.1 cupin domain-containing protein [Acidimicrobiia bacterium]
MNADEVIEALQLRPHAAEGGHFTEVWRDEHSTAIYYFLAAGEVSAMHRLDAAELWHFYAGAPVQMLLLRSDSTIGSPTLGADLAAGQRPCVAIPAGTWMGGEPLGTWSLIGATVAPPYHDGRFELADRADLLARYPDATERITRLTP